MVKTDSLSDPFGFGSLGIQNVTRPLKRCWVPVCLSHSHTRTPATDAHRAHTRPRSGWCKPVSPHLAYVPGDCGTRRSGLSGSEAHTRSFRIRSTGSEPEGESGAPLTQQGELGPSVAMGDVPPHPVPKLCSSVQDALSRSCPGPDLTKSHVRVSWAAAGVPGHAGRADAVAGAEARG